MLAKALRTHPYVRLLADDPAAEQDVFSMCEAAQHEVLSCAADGRVLNMIVRDPKSVGNGRTHLSPETEEKTPVTPKQPSSQKEPRAAQRIRMQAKIDYSSDNNFYSGFSTNISDGGVFIATVKLVAIGTQIDLFFRLPNGEGIEAHGVVKWVREVDDSAPENMPGIGVQFVQLPDSAKSAIMGFIREREPMFFPD
jgi:uncharacterized protein (TIGR02266 family)